MEINESIHYSIKRYTVMASSIYVTMREKSEMQFLHTTYPELLLEREKWEVPLNNLTSEVLVLLEKFSEVINEDVSD